MAFQRRDAPLESRAETCRHRMGSRNRSADGAATNSNQCRATQKALRPCAGNPRRASADDFSGQPRHSGRSQKEHRQLPSRRNRALRAVERRAVVSAKRCRECPPMTPVRTLAEKKAPRAWDDTRLVKECLRGNEQAWSLLIDKYKALIYSIPVKYGLLAQDAADVFQATCAELLVRLPELREPRALPKWLMQVAHHECYRCKRQQQRVVSRDSDEDLPEPEVPAIAEDLVQQTQEEQMLR